MTNDQATEFDRELFTARALGYLCLHFADLSQKTVLEQGDFLMGLGLPRPEAALVSGSTDESLRVLAHQRAKQQASGKGAVREGKSA